MNKKKLDVDFHPNRPLIMVTYTADPIPWWKVIVYRAKHDDQTARVSYNSSYYIMCPINERLQFWVTPDYIMNSATMVHGKRYKMKTSVRLYDYTEGRFVGRMIIPQKERCIGWRISINDRIFLYMGNSSVNVIVFIACQSDYV
jgi:hypothetical protein